MMIGMGWLRLVGFLKLHVSFAEYHLFYRAILQKRPIILRSLSIVATSYSCNHSTECPPDPINHVCSLTGKYISKIHFTYCPVQIYKIMFRRFLFSRIWSSAQKYAVLGVLLNPVVFLISTWQNLSGGNDLYWRCTSFEKAVRRGQPLNILHDS